MTEFGVFVSLVWFQVAAVIAVMRSWKQWRHGGESGESGESGDSLCVYYCYTLCLRQI
jgi:hypothetical protein